MPSAEQTLAQIDAAIEGNQSRRQRAHLGWSVIGNECERALWFGFRHATPIDHPARLLRIFRRGNAEEPTFYQMLRDADITVWDEDPETGGQWMVSEVGGHFGGSLDGVVKGLPESPDEAHVLELKTSSDKAFRALLKSGSVQDARPIHYSQMQGYMLQMQLDWALYMVVNKSDDALYIERVPLDREFAQTQLDKARRVITSDWPPVGGSDDPAWFECKFCDHHAVCHGQRAPQVSCRTCSYATPEMDGDGRWPCGRDGRDLTLEDQRIACDQHVFIPSLFEKWAEIEDGDKTFVEYRTKRNGHIWRNGKDGYSSREIAAAADLNALGHPAVDAIRDHFDGEVVG